MSDFVFVSGRLCLDLAGTRLWRRSLRTELLNSPDDLRRWIGEAELLDDPGPIDARALERTKRLREAVYRLVSSWPPRLPWDADLEEALAEVNDCARLPVPKLQIDQNARLTRTGGIDEVLGAVGRDAVDLLASPRLSLVKECANPDCTRLFIDLSRSTSRRWCGMAECGNRHKAASYRQRKRTPPN